MRQSGIIIWTVYFDSQLSRKEGRRLPLSLCVKCPSLSEIEATCKSLGLTLESVKKAKYPRCWWKEGGYVVVKRGEMKKGELLKLVARELRKARSLEASR